MDGFYGEQQITENALHPNSPQETDTSESIDGRDFPSVRIQHSGDNVVFKERQLGIRIGEIKTARQSSHLAWLSITPTSPHWTLRVYDPAARRERIVPSPPRRNVTSFAISPDGTTLLFHSEMLEGAERGNWLASVVDTDGTFQSDEIRGLPLGSPEGVALSYWVGVIGVDANEAVQIFRVSLPEHGWPTSCEATLIRRYQHPAHVEALSSDGGLVAVSHSNHPESNPLRPAIDILNVNTGETVIALPPCRATYRRLAEFAPDPQDHRLLVQEEGRDGYANLSLVDTDTGESFPLRISLIDPADFDGTWLTKDQLLISGQLGMNTFFYKYHLPTETLTAIDVPDNVNPHPLPYGSGDLSRPSVSPDGIFLLASKYTHQPRYVKLHPNIQLKRYPEDDVAIKEIRIPRTGTFREIPILLFNAKSHKLPSDDRLCIVKIHGGPHGVSANTFDGQRALFLRQGHMVVEVNYRGSTGYGNDWRDAFLDAPAFRSVDDIRTVLDWLDERLDPEWTRVLAGASWGGYLALLTAALIANDSQQKKVSVFEGVIAEVPITDPAAIYWTMTAELRKAYRQRFGGTPEELSEVYRKASPANYPPPQGDESAPWFLITAGATDPRCPADPIVEYVHMLQRHGVRVVSKILQGGHVASGPERDELDELIMGFLQQLAADVSRQRSLG